MFLKRFTASALTIILLCAGSTAFAEEVRLGGQPVGIEISTRGVLVAGVRDVETADGTRSPASEAGIRPGDIIVAVEEKTVESASEVIETLNKLGGSAVHLTLSRSGKSFTAEVTPALSAEGQTVLGVLLKDGISGIGTLTFYDPDTGAYGALGHSVADSTSGAVIEPESGSIFSAEISGIIPGSEGAPGELKGITNSARTLGNIGTNAYCGIFGTAYEALGGDTVETGTMIPGKAQLITTVEGHECRAYSVTVDRVYTDQGSKRALITVTDPLLIALTGGIVQGMSGSPIMQEGKLVGAVTHVYVDDPKRGCCIGIEEMLERAGISAA